MATMLSDAMTINGSRLVAECDEPHWYAVQTCANHEKRVRQQLDLRVVETYLPLYESVRYWKDRRVRSWSCRSFPAISLFVCHSVTACECCELRALSASSNLAAKLRPFRIKKSRRCAGDLRANGASSRILT